MFDFLIYLGQSALCLAALYLIYKVAMSHETLHVLNRVILLGSVILSALLPLCRVKVVKEYDFTPATISSVEVDDTVVVADVAELGIDYVSLFKEIAVAAFIIGLAFMVVRLVVSTYSVWRLIHSGRMSVIEDEVTLTVVSKLSTPFSWFGHIVASEEDMQTYRDMIITHELAHIRLRHSWDVMFADLALCLWWFNPAMWLLRRELQSLHEYQADDAVLNEGVDAKNYQMLLIKRAVGSRLHSVANCLNHSNIKNRITMMCKKTSSRWTATKALLVLPVVAISLSAFATTVYVPRDVQDKVTENSVNNKNLKPAIIEIKGSEIYLNNEQVTAAGLEAVIEDYRLQTLIYDENDAASKRTYEAIHNTLKLNGNIDAIYPNGKRPEVSVVRISGDKIYLNDEQITLEQLKAKADENSATIINLQADADTSMGMVTEVKEAFRNTSHAVKVNYEKEDELIAQKQELEQQKDQAYIKVEKMPTFNGGDLNAYRNWFQSQIQYPAEAAEKNISGRVIFSFVVEKDGSTSNYTLLKSPDKILSAEVERVFKTTPKWEAGEQGGKKVRVKYTVPIVFVAQGAGDAVKMQEFEQNKQKFEQQKQGFEQQKQEFEQKKQEFEQQKDQAYIKVEKMPTFNGGDLNAYRNWFQSQIQYPAEAAEKKLQGRVIFSFVVEKDGSTSNYTLLKSPDKILSAEVERVFKTTPKWEAGEQGGEKVRVKYTVPIVFVVQGDDTANAESLKAFNTAMAQIQKGDALSEEISQREYKDNAELKADQSRANDYYRAAVSSLESAYQIDSKHKPTVQALSMITFRLRDEAGMMAKYEKYKKALAAL